MHYSYQTTVVKIEEKFTNGAAVKDTDGKWAVPEVSRGWFIITANNIAHGIGAEQPQIKAGDVIKITLEKI